MYLLGIGMEGSKSCQIKDPYIIIQTVRGGQGILECKKDSIQFKSLNLLEIWWIK